MLALYLDLLESAHEVDVAGERTSTRRQNQEIRGKLISLSESKFRKRYRLSTELFTNLVEELRPHLPPTRRSDALDVESKILLALSFYATGSYQTPVGDTKYHPASQASVSKAVNEVTNALNNPAVLNKYVAFPLRRAERENIKQRFYTATRLPGVLGCIDGTHVAIIKPIENEERYINRKGYHSMNVLIMCDVDLNIMMVDSSYPGSTHDWKVWERHSLKAFIDRLYGEEHEDIYVLGDAGYPARTTLVTPVTNAEPESLEAYFNDLHGSARCSVERCIGVLKARFRCLLADRTLHYAPTTAAKIINACCVLHNIAHGAGIEYEPLTSQQLHREHELTVSASFRRPPETHANRRALLAAGRERREQLMRRLWRQRNII